MDGFTAAYLANLLANLSAQMIPKASRRLQEQWQGTPTEAALKRCLQNGISMMVSKASADLPEKEGLLEDIFSAFFADAEVAIHLMSLLRLQPLNLVELEYLFTEAGYDAATLPGLRFDEAMTAFEVAFLETAALEPALQPIIQVHQGWERNELQRQMVNFLQQAVALLQEMKDQPLGIHAGRIMAENVVSGSQTIIYQWPGRLGPDNSAQTAYLTWLMDERQTLSLRAISAGKTGGKERPPELAEVYVALNTKTTKFAVDKGDQEIEAFRAMAVRDEQPLSALQALAMNQRLVLLGEPGSGKSTFVSHLAYCLAAHALYPADGWLARLPDWSDEKANLLPLFVILRDFARWLPTPLPPRAYVHHLWDFIADTLGKEKLESVLPLLEKGLADGEVLLLLDGLDEVTNQEQRRFVRDAVLAFGRRYGDGSLLVTCRVLSYQPPDPEKEEEELRLPATDYPAVELALFNAEQRNAFIHAWYSELKRQGHLPGLDESRLSRDLQGAIGRSDLQRIAGNPLLLTVMAMVHVEDGRLPDSRALLYNKAIDLLLLRWEETKGEDEVSLLRQMLQEANRTEVDLKTRLAAVAFQAHTQAGTSSDGERVSDVGEGYLCQELSGLHKKDLGWGQRLLAVIKSRAGLLVERSPGQFAFPHRTFQEYLAGAYLAAQPDFVARSLDWARRDIAWWPMVLFAVEHLVYVHERPLDPLPLISKLCPEKIDESTAGWRQVWLAGEALLSLGQERAEDSEWGQQLLERARQRLVALLKGERLTPRERAEAGQVLARLGDPRPGVGVDPTNGLPDILWSEEIAAKTYTIGDDRGSSDEKIRPALIGTSYHIARYPITNAQFQCFLDAPDRDDEEWWQGIPGEERQFSEPEWPYANHPRETVSWYHATAFCKWLTDKLRKGLLPEMPVPESELERWEIALPHEYEWEVATRWPNKDVQERIYPWGSTFDAAKANTSEGARVGQTTAVGLYPSGKNEALDLYDLSGNVWEWCRNKYNNPENETIDGVGRVLRGGSWNNYLNPARAAYRHVSSPDYRVHYVGFRVVVVRRPPSHPGL